MEELANAMIEAYFFLRQFPKLFCLQRRHVGYTHFGTFEFANSIRPIFDTPLHVIDACKYSPINQ
jgi:hypothetical protein